MFFIECRKLLIKQKGLILIIIFLLFKMAFITLRGYDSEYIIDINTDGYNKYINLYKGKLTEKKIKDIEKEAYKINNVLEDLDYLINQKKEGKISKKEYDKEVISCYERYNNADVFNIIYNQYLYAKKKPNERYIMDERGWNTILTHGNPDFFLILCLILVLTPLFCIEYENEMDMLIISTKIGKYKFVIIKLLIGVTIAVVITIMFSLIEYILINQMIGLNSWSYPLQSLEYFSNSRYNITIFGAYIFVILCRIFGSILLVSFISLISVKCKKTIVTLVISSIIVFLPYIIFQGKSVLYYLPLPSGFFTGEGYLWGTSYVTEVMNDGTIKRVTQFMEISKNSFLLIVVGNILLINIFNVLILRDYSKLNFKFLKFIQRVKISIVFIIIFFTSIFNTGCTKKQAIDDKFTVCASEALYQGETFKYIINFDVAQQMIVAKDKKSGEEIQLLRDPFERNKYIYGIFVQDPWCYYIEKENSKQGFRVYGIDLNNFNQKLIYNNINENLEFIFEIVNNKNSVRNLIEIMNGYRGFFLDNEYIYCLDMQDRILQINRNTGKEKVIAFDARYSGTAYFHNGDIYYSDIQNRLCVFRKDENQVYRIDNIYTNKFSIQGNRIKYEDLLDNNKIQYYNIDS